MKSNILNPGLNIIIDGQWGSTGKGKLCGWLGSTHNGPIDVCASSFGPNAGHTYIDSSVSGMEKTILKALPTSCLTAPCEYVCILPDSVFHLDRLLDELQILRGYKDVLGQVMPHVIIHPLAAVATLEDKKAAQQTGARISGTMQGTGHALSKKMLRVPEACLAEDYTDILEDTPGVFVRDTSPAMQQCQLKGGVGIVEVSQGFDLSLNHGHSYPYLTSRDITAASALNACGCPILPYNIHVIGSIRCHPIRVGNLEGSTSGPHYDDQVEIGWNDVSFQSGGDKTLIEYTTVTGRVRRVFTFSIQQLTKFIRYNQPDCLFLNFVQYLDSKVAGVTNADDLMKSSPVRMFIKSVLEEGGVHVKMVGTGADNKEMVVL